MRKMTFRGTELASILATAADAVAAASAELNRLDGFAGDGDLGITMSAAARALNEVLVSNRDANVAELLAACGAAIAKRAPSTAGTLLATGFLRAGQAVAELSGSDVEMVARAFDAALAGIQRTGKAAVGDRTMVDALHAACTSLSASALAGARVTNAVRAAAEAAAAATKATVDMEPRIGRASWAPQRAIGHPDAGCTMLTIALQAVAEVLEGT
jgi:dihydroxyacetone kinase